MQTSIKYISILLDPNYWFININFILQLEMILITFTLLSSFIEVTKALKIWRKEYKVQYLDPEHSGEAGESRIAYKDLNKGHWRLYFNFSGSTHGGKRKMIFWGNR